MKDIKNVAILGAGAIGAYFASRFFDTEGFKTVLLARGERLARLKKEGLLINDQHYQIDSIDPTESNRAMDLVVVAVKHHQLDEALSHLDPLVSDSTVFISMMNGLESEKIIGAKYGMNKVLYAIVISLDGQRVANRISYSNPGVHVFGEADNRVPSENVKRVQAAFDRADIRYQTPDDMTRMLWWKFMINVGVNQASAVLGAPYEVFQSSRHAQLLKESLMEEVVELAKLQNVNLTRKDIDDWYEVLKTVDPQGKTSMLQDLEAGRTTEVEIFGDAVVRMGQELGVDTPVNLAVSRIIHAIQNE